MKVFFSGKPASHTSKSLENYPTFTTSVHMENTVYIALPLVPVYNGTKLTWLDFYKAKISCNQFLPIHISGGLETQSNKSKRKYL